MPKKKLPKGKDVKHEKPSKANRFAIEEDFESAEEMDGEPVKQKKKKKETGITAIRYKKVMDATLGNSRKTLEQAMIDEGFSPSYAKSGQIKRQPTWNALVKERFHDDKLSNIHSQLLVAKKIDYMLFNAEIEDSDIYELLESVGSVVKKIVHGIQGTHVWFWCADHRIRKDAVELDYKVGGKMAPEKYEVEQEGIQAMSDEDLAALIKKQKARFKKTD